MQAAVGPFRVELIAHKRLRFVGWGTRQIRRAWQQEKRSTKMQIARQHIDYSSAISRMRQPSAGGIIHAQRHGHGRGGSRRWRRLLAREGKVPTASARTVPKGVVRAVPVVMGIAMADGAQRPLPPPCLRNERSVRGLSGKRRAPASCLLPRKEPRLDHPNRPDTIVPLVKGSCETGERGTQCERNAVMRRLRPLR